MITDDPRGADARIFRGQEALTGCGGNGHLTVTHREPTPIQPVPSLRYRGIRGQAAPRDSRLLAAPGGRPRGRL